MAEDFSAELLAQVGWRWTSGAVIDEARVRFSRTLSNGIGADQAEAVWYDLEAVLADGGERIVDLTALRRWVFEDELLTALATVRALVVVNQSTGPARLVVGGAASDEWSAPFGAAGDKLVLPPDAVLVLAAPRAGWPVDAARCKLRLAATGGAATYSIAVVGTLTLGGGSSSGA
jgi:hypothetical protein